MPEQPALKLDAGRRLPALHAERNHRRRGVPVRAGDERRAARGRHVVEHPVAPDRRRRSSASSTPARRRTSALPVLAIVIVRDDLLGKALHGDAGRSSTTKTMAANGSMLEHAADASAGIVAGLVFKWIKAQGRPDGDVGAQRPQGGAALRLHRRLSRSTATRWQGRAARG